MRFRVSIVGTGKTEPALDSEEGQELIEKLCEGPVRKSDISSELFEKFTRVRAVREENGECFLNFTCFTARDIEILNRECDLSGRDLAGNLLKKVNLHPPKGLSFEEVSWKKSLFFLVGCVCLDWYALRVFDQLGLLLPEEQKKKAGYGDYTLFANEDIPRNLEKLYWGSHNMKYGSFWFTSFGDHANTRRTFPDISWMISSFSGDEVIAMVSSRMVDNYMKKIAKHVVERSWKGTGFQEVLEKLSYVKDNEIAIPVFIKRDIPRIKHLISEVISVLHEWLGHEIRSIKKSFRDLTPNRFGVDFKEVMLHIWHYMFGHTNKHLSSDERFFDPYSEESEFKGFLPVIHESGCFF